MTPSEWRRTNLKRPTVTRLTFMVRCKMAIWNAALESPVVLGKWKSRKLASVPSGVSFYRQCTCRTQPSCASLHDSQLSTARVMRPEAIENKLIQGETPWMTRWMTRSPVVVESSEKLATVRQKMDQGNFHRVPVVDGKLVGIHRDLRQHTGLLNT